MTEPFIRHSGIAAPLLRDNVDTDQIIPSREMKTVSKAGLGKGLFAAQRYLFGYVVNPDFVLNQPDYANATILLSGSNFGCGSSREHAVWALKDYGFRAVIAESFGEIFYNNCIRNSILPIQLSAGIIATLEGQVEIDLPAQTVNGQAFKIAAGEKSSLIKGLDPIAQTLEHVEDIEAFFAGDQDARPWVYSIG